MHDLQLNGVKVHASFLTQRAHRAVYCDFLLPVTRRNLKESLAVFRRSADRLELRGLHVSGVADLSFLEDFPNLLYLEIVDQKQVDTKWLKGLENLRGLRLETPGTGIDFGWFPLLEVFVGDWHVDNCNLDQSVELRQLRAWHFNPPTSDLSPLKQITRLEQLELTQTNISSLDGLETLEDLRHLELAYAPQLESLDRLASPGVGIRELSLSKAKKIASYLPIAAISHLRRLKLFDCTPMSDLKWMDGMNHLDFFSFVGTNLVDGNLTPLLSLPNLKYVGSMDKRHYSHKCNAFNELLSQRNPK